VFVPISFLPGTAGRLFREFGIVLAAAVIISSFVALSLVPAAAARLLKGEDDYRVPNVLARLGQRMTAGYQRSLAVLLNHPWLTVSAAMLFAVGGIAAYQALDRELIPSEDRGVINIFASGPDGDRDLPIYASGEASGPRSLVFDPGAGPPDFGLPRPLATYRYDPTNGVRSDGDIFVTRGMNLQ